MVEDTLPVTCGDVRYGTGILGTKGGFDLVWDETTVHDDRAAMIRIDMVFHDTENDVYWKACHAYAIGKHADWHQVFEYKTEEWYDYPSDEEIVHLKRVYPKVTRTTTYEEE